MTFKERFDLINGDWRYKAVLVNHFHAIKIIKTEHWTVRKTAEYFGISTGYVSESFKIANRLAEIVEAETRQEALEILK